MGAITPALISGVPGLATMLGNGGYQILTDRPTNVFGATPIPVNFVHGSSIRGYTARTRHRALFPATHIRLVFGNCTADNSLTETPNHNAVEYRAALQKFGSSVTDYTPARIPVTFNNGSQFGICPPDGILFSDPIAFDVAGNELFFIWMGIAASGPSWYLPAGAFLQGGTATGGLANGDAYGIDDTVQSGNPTAALSSNATGPLAVLGFSSIPQRTVALFGDSIFQGTGDYGSYLQNGGWGQRLMINQTTMILTPANSASQIANFPYVWMARGGEQAAQTAARANSYKQVKIAEMATTILWEYGTNDLSGGLAALQANTLAVAQWFISRGKKFIAATLLPKTTTTDNFLTIANQTVTSGESVRTAYNSWLRDPSANGFISWASGLSGPAWVQSTAYATIGAVVQTAGGVYAVTSPGTSAASGAGPSGVGTGIVDGTVLWQSLTPNTGLVDFIDPAASVEVNASGVTTLNGGFWPPPPAAIDYSGTITTANSAGQWTDSGLANAQDQYRGYNVRITTPGANGYTTSGMNLGHSLQSERGEQYPVGY